MGMAEIPDELQGEGIGLLPGAELQATRESVYVDYRQMSLCCIRRRQDGMIHSPGAMADA